MIAKYKEKVYFWSAYRVIYGRDRTVKIEKLGDFQTDTRAESTAYRKAKKLFYKYNIASVRLERVVERSWKYKPTKQEEKKLAKKGELTEKVVFNG